MFSVFTQVKHSAIGKSENRVRLGEFEIAFSDEVLVIESRNLTHVSSRITPKKTRIVVRDDDLLIDFWEERGGAISIGATSDELITAQVYFRDHGFAV
ncbi:hypothetical protein NU688_32350 [Variovorax sp. ZS18.2.2]|uniref:hypothetical protein n=1 Tax=Variovorax sp. ZS18.2.2 TaxID=2971255 RepID=UPI0021508A67|nr:hypothetical protein [Variovorax sp. ZS18.2.2]MCR6480887.1 hypothetical protein [Variovorax sp. ZS18.2.2]